MTREEWNKRGIENEFKVGFNYFLRFGTGRLGLFIEQIVKIVLSLDP